MALVVKNLPANAGNIKDMGSIPGWGRSPGEEHGNPLQYSCLENPMDRGASRATVHRVAKSWTRLKWLSSSSSRNEQGFLDFLGGSAGKEFTCSAEDLALIPGLGRSLGEEHGNPLQYSCLENPMNRGAWQAIVHGVTKCQTRLND